MVKQLYLPFLFTIGLCLHVRAQENYEIQVYSAPTMPKGQTIVELHSNTSLKGTNNEKNGVLPTENVLRETIEITRGFSDIFEIGVYFFTNISPGRGWDFVGSHIRPRIMAPSSWNLPVGLSLSLEAGRQKRIFSEDEWSVEIRPIIDKTIGNCYLSFNPTLEKSLDNRNTPLFSPNIKFSYTIKQLVAVGLEYYGSTGPVINWDRPNDQSHLMMLALDWYFSPKWEINMGWGKGLTSSTDGTIVKLLVGKRFGT